MKKQYTIEDLKQIIVRLRAEDGCPWDRVQTHETLKKDMIEEAYEAVEAINKQDNALLANELGDVLLQVVFHACIAEEENTFTLDDVLNEICTKLIMRHTYVFGDETAHGQSEALDAWERNKIKEKGIKSHSENLRDVPAAFPALMRAEKVQKRAAKIGFDWDSAEEVFEKTDEELSELKEALAGGDAAHIEEEYGDLLFTAVNLGRHLGLNPEQSLTAATDKFIARFTAMEELANAENLDFDRANAQKLDKLWKKVKQNS